MHALIATLPGDGVGPEVTSAATAVLRAVASRFGHEFEFAEAPIGGAAIEAHASPLPKETRDLCIRADAVLLGAVGGPAWDANPPHLRPERGLLDLRSGLRTFANLRPVRVRPGMAARGPLRREIAESVDMLIVRELTGGIYFGERRRERHWASDECRYDRTEIARVARIALALARTRSGRVHSLDKANVLETSRLWRETVSTIAAAEFPEIDLRHQLIDSAAMRIITSPREFDVILTENMFGDIISDEASVLAGSLGLLGSASIGGARPGIFEPIHGSAPDIAGTGRANPIGAIAAAAMLLEFGLGLTREARTVENAIDSSLEGSVATPDCAGSATTGEVAEQIVSHILKAAPQAAGTLAQ